MGVSIQQLLAPQVILRTVSRIQLPGTTLSKLFGWNVGAGPIMGAMFAEGNEGEGGSNNPAGNVEDWELRTGQYDIFDITREIPDATAPGTPPNRIKPQKAGYVHFTVPRANDRMTLTSEDIHNRRQIGAADNVIDRNGQRYVQAQTRYMAARFANMVEFQTAAMLRGSYSFTQEGARLRQGFSGGDITINYQIPADNKDQLALGTGSDIIDADWDTASTDIPQHLFAINAAFVQQVGTGIAHAICSSTVWNHVVNNTAVHTQGGTSQRVFDYIERNGPGEFTAVLRSIPWLQWHIVDYGLDMPDTSTTGTATTFTRMIPTDACVFLPEVDGSWSHYIRGGEHVVEGPNGSESFQYGFYAYAYPEYEPAGHNLVAIHNGFPALPVPKAIAFGTVTGF